MKFGLKRPSRKQRQLLIPRVELKNHNGQFEIMGLGVWHSYWRDPYHLLLTIPWTGFLILIVCSYLMTNTLFAFAFLAGGNCIANARPGSFSDNFFFSVQTLATIGYGSMYPKTLYANIVVIVEVMVGLVAIAMMTGLSYARFSQPIARVLFSRVALVLPYNGVPTLTFRTANQRLNIILEAQMRAYLMRDEVTMEGQFIRRIHDLKLLRDETPGFALTWLAMHVVDKSSPFYGVTPESLIQTNAMLVVSLSGIDETVNQTVHARYTYGSDEILWNYQFVDIIHHTDDGHRYIDYNHFHDIVPLKDV